MSGSPKQVNAEEPITAIRALCGKSLLPVRRCTDWSPHSLPDDSKYLLSVSGDSTARIWHIETGKQIGEPIQHNSVVRTCGWGLGGRFFFTTTAPMGSHLPEIRFYETNEEKTSVKLIKSIFLQKEDYIYASLLGDMNERLYTGFGDGSVAIWDVQVRI